jgi:ATP-dependent Clp protease ATP-binding subunit ClpC
MNWFKSLRKALTATQPGGSHGSDESLSNFTPYAQQVLALARKEAERFRHNFVGTEHLLLGIVNLGQGTAFTVLRNMGLDSETLRLEVEKQVGTGPDDRMIGNIPYTPRVKKVLALAARESRELNHTYVGTEHILLGLLREGDGVAARVLKNLHVDIEQTRQEILRELDSNSASTAKSTKASPSKATFTSSAPVLRSTLHIEPPVPKRDSVDTSKRYDVYCA